MKKDIKRRLKSYGIAATALISAGESGAKIVYTDVNPDQTFSLNGTAYTLDLNNDNTIDFRVEFYKSSSGSFSYFFSYFRIVANPLNLNEVAASSSYYPFAMNVNANIGPSLPWTSTSYALMAAHWFWQSGTSQSSGTYGNWSNVQNKYLGLKLKVGANTYYGWARLDVNATTGSFTIKDYAYEDAANTSILAGALPGASPATNVIASDVNENSNGSDLQVSFDKASDESQLTEYRIMVVKASKAATFSVTAASAVASGNYTAVMPNGSNVSMTLSASARDTDGDNVVIGLAYKIFVLSKANGTTVTFDGLSNASNQLTLNTHAGITANLVGSDVANHADASDVNVSFTKALNEAGIAEYRVILVPESEASSFGLSAAIAVAGGNYEAINPNGSNISQSLNAATRDKNGDPLAENKDYRFFVLSVANMTKANIDTLSAMSNKFNLGPYTGLQLPQTLSTDFYSAGKTLFVELGEHNSPARLYVRDLRGRLILEREIHQKSEQFLMDGAGIFVVTLIKGDQTINRKVAFGN